MLEAFAESLELLDGREVVQRPADDQAVDVLFADQVVDAVAAEVWAVGRSYRSAGEDDQVDVVVSCRFADTAPEVRLVPAVAVQLVDQQPNSAALLLPLAPPCAAACVHV